MRSALACTLCALDEHNQQQQQKQGDYHVAEAIGFWFWRGIKIAVKVAAQTVILDSDGDDGMLPAIGAFRSGR